MKTHHHHTHTTGTYKSDHFMSTHLCNYIHESSHESSNVANDVVAQSLKNSETEDVPIDIKTKLPSKRSLKMANVGDPVKKKKCHRTQNWTTVKSQKHAKVQYNVSVCMLKVEEHLKSILEPIQMYPELLSEVKSQPNISVWCINVTIINHNGVYIHTEEFFINFYSVICKVKIHHTHFVFKYLILHDVCSLYFIHHTNILNVIKFQFI